MPVNYIDGATIKGTPYELHDPRTDHKAEIDGSYADLTAGNAEQLVSTVGIEDKVPYNFRTSGGTADIGDREEDTVVGGSVVWNQHVQNGNFADATGWSSYSASKTSISVENNVLTVNFLDNWQSGMPSYGFGVTTTLKGAGNVAYKSIAGHKYFIGADLNVTKAGEYGFDVNGSTGEQKLATITTINAWVSVGKIFNAVSNTSTIFIIEPYLTEVTTSDTMKIRNVQYIDLTQMFGSTIADYLHQLEAATTGAGFVWFKKLFQKAYYPYDAGTLMHVQTSAHEMTGFNQWDEEWELGGWNHNTGAKTTATDRIRSKNYIPVVPNTRYFINAGYAVSCCYDKDKNFIGDTPYAYASVSGMYYLDIPDNAYFITFNMPPSYGTTYNNNICINISWDGERNGEYEPYKLTSYPLDDSLTLRGIPKLDSNNSLYYDGDVYSPDGTVTRRFGIVDLGTLTWAKTAGSTSDYDFFENVSLTPVPVAPGTLNVIMPLYQTVNAMTTSTGQNKAVRITGQSFIRIRDTSYTDAASFKAAMSGVYLVYELATPTTETADPYQTPQIVDDFGTEEYVDAGERNVEIPVGHETVYRNNLRAKLEMAPESPDGNGDYIVRQTNGQNEYVPLVIPAELPSNPSENGNYILKATVTNGTTVLSWEVQA